MANLSAQKQSRWEKFGSFIARPATAFAVLCFVILINIFTAYSNLNNSVASDQPELTTTEEYTQVATNFYDLENINP